MTNNHTPEPIPDLRHVFLDVAGLMARYPLGRTATDKFAPGEVPRLPGCL